MIKMSDMKKLIILASLFVGSLIFAQENNPLFEKDGDKVKVTYFYKNGNIKQQGFYKDKLLTGTWATYDENGNKKVVAQYKEGKKVGKWLIWNNGELKEVNYEQNTVASVQTRKEDTNIAIK